MNYRPSPRIDHPGVLNSPLRMPTAATRMADDHLVIAIVIATVTYQALLCMLNTHGLHASRALIGLSEGVILLACLPLIARRMLPGVIIIATLAGGMFCLQSLTAGQLNVKTFRDLAVPLCYFWVGCNIGRPQLADRALLFAIGIVMILGFIELFFLDQYTNVFNIYSYYVNTGNLLPNTEFVNTSKLQLNGTRPEGIGRTLLPSLLGSHRVSSVFLEPVSLGNFATICAAWGLSKDKSELRQMIFYVSMAVIFMVISDSRFALTTVTLMVAMRLVLSGKGLYVAILGPFVAVVLIVYLGIGTHGFSEDSFRGRLSLSGQALLEFNVSTIFATTISSDYADMGYAHLISAFGLPVCLMLWFSLWFLPMPDERGNRFRAYASLYIVLILCVSGFSLYALKTSGILWFLMGCCLRNPAPLPKTNPSPEPDSEPILLDVNNQIRRTKDVY